MADIIDINVYETTETVAITVTPNLTTININSVTSGGGGVPSLQDVTDVGATTTNSITANSFIKSGGTSSQFLKANGSVDSNIYGIDSNLVHKTGAESIAGLKTFTNGIFANSNTETAVIATSSKSYGLIATSNSSVIPSAIFNISQASNPNEIVRFQKEGTTLASVTNLGQFSGAGFIKTGGTSSQFLKADGSIDSNTYLTSASNYWTKTGDDIVKNNTGNVYFAGDGTDSVPHARYDSTLNAITGSFSNGDFNNNSIGIQQVTDGITMFINNSDGLRGWLQTGRSLTLNTTYSTGFIDFMINSVSKLKLNNNGTLKYATDVSSLYDARTLIDKGYADATYVLPSNVVTLTGNQNIQGIKTFTNFGVLQNVVLNNGNTNISSSAVIIANVNGGLGIKSENTGTGTGIYSNSTSTGLNYVGANNGTTTFFVNKEGEITANKFIKSGGTSSQYLMADGSVSTGGGTTPTLQQVTTAGSTSSNAISINIPSNTLSPAFTVTSDDINSNGIPSIKGIGVNDTVGVFGTSDDNTGVFGTSIDGNAIVGISTNSIGGVFFSTTGKASTFNINTSNTSNIVEFQKNNINQAYITHNGTIVSNKILINTTTDNGVDKLQVNGTASGSAATLSNQFVIKSQLDLKANNNEVVKQIVNEFPATTVTGTLSDTLLSTFTILGGTLPASCMPDIRIKFSKSGDGGTAQMRLRINTVNNFATSTQIATFQVVAASDTFLVSRNPVISGGNMNIFIATSAAQSDISNVSITESNFSINVANDIYLFVSITQGNAGDTTTLRAFKIIN